MDRNELEVSGLTTPTSHVSNNIHIYIYIYIYICQTSEDQLMSFERLLSTASNDLGSLNGRSQSKIKLHFH